MRKNYNKPYLRISIMEEDIEIITHTSLEVDPESGNGEGSDFEEGWGDVGEI